MRNSSRPATESDIKALYGNVPVTMRARVMEVDGEIAAILGYRLIEGAAVVFSEIRKPIPRSAIWREARQFMSALKLPAICVAESPASVPLLKRLGWETENDEVFTWRT